VDFWDEELELGAKGEEDDGGGRSHLQDNNDDDNDDDNDAELGFLNTFAI
jgi:hypothetical protein